MEVGSIQFLVLIPISLRFVLILSSHLRLDFPIFFFPFGLSVNILKALLPSSILTIWPTHFNYLDLITLTILGERYKLWNTDIFCFFTFLCWISTVAKELKVNVRKWTKILYTTYRNRQIEPRQFNRAQRLRHRTHSQSVHSINAHSRTENFQVIK